MSGDGINMSNTRRLTVTTCIVLLLVCLSQMQAQAPDTLWTRTYGGPTGDFCWSMQKDNDDGYILAGYTYSYGAGMLDFYLVKTDENGDTLWTRTYGSVYSDEAYAACATSDAGYILAGRSELWPNNYHMWIVKVDSVGDTLWTRLYQHGGRSEARSIVECATSDGYVVAGFADAGTRIMKIDLNGDTVWIRGGSYGGYFDVVETTDSAYVATGVMGIVYNLVLDKRDGDGTTCWGQYYDLIAHHATSVCEAHDGGFAITGFNTAGIFLVRTDSLGDTLWVKTYADAAISRAYCVIQTMDHAFVITGLTGDAGDVDVLVMKVNPAGDTMWTTTIGGPDTDIGYAIQQTPDSGYVIAGLTESFGSGDADYWLLRLATEGSVVEHSVSSKNSILGPTILSGPLRLPEGKKCRVFDIMGRVVASDKMRPGIYFIEIDGRISEKVVKIR